MQNIFNNLDSIPESIKNFLKEIITNTKEGDYNVLSLADSFVITGFFIQKWVAFGFRWCLSQLRSTLKGTLSEAQGARLVECIRVAQQLVFCTFTFNSIELDASYNQSDFDLDQLNDFIRGCANRVPNFYR